MKKVYIVCSSVGCGIDNVLLLLQRRKIKHLEPIESGSVVTDLQLDIIQQTGLEEEWGFKSDWFQGYQRSYMLVMKKLMEANTDDESNYFIYTPYNYLFIELWRIIGKRLNIEISFLVLHKSVSKLILSNENEMNLKKAVTSLYAIACQADVDMYFFDENDFTSNEYVVGKYIDNIVGSTYSYGFANMPIKKISENIKDTDNIQPSVLNLPYEVVQLEKYFSNKKFGTQIFINKESFGFKQLAVLFENKSALYYWFEYLTNSSNEVVLEVVVPAPAKIRRKELDSYREELQNAFKVQYQKLRADNMALKSMNEEFNSVVPQAKERVPRKVAKAENVSEKKKSQSIKKVELSPLERKKRKFKKDPYAFFQDSKNPVFRLGHVFFKQKGN